MRSGLAVLVSVLVSVLVLLAACSAPPPKPAATPGADDGLAWARGKVWYQVFPERFRNGDRSNDPSSSDVPEIDDKSGWRISPWTSDWYQEQPWELKRSTDFYNSEVVFARRYGGDLQGVIDKLDYLKDLGVDVIYLNPIFEAPSLHKYDASSLHHVDLHFGPDPAGDKALLAEAKETEDPATWIWTKADITFLHLVKEAHNRGIKVVIDGVFNHTGRGFFAFQDILKKGRKSRYASWYMVTKWPDQAGGEPEYKAWWGFKSLPVLARDERGLAPGPKKYIFAITKRWLSPPGNPKGGVDGFRLDVIEEVPAPFWKEWQDFVKRVKPDALTVAEIWGDASPWVKDGRVDSTMNYQFAMAVARFFIDRKKAVSGGELASRFRKLLDSYPPAKAQLLLNLVDSHDTDRLASQIRNPDRDYNQKAGPRESPVYDVRAPDDVGRRVQKQVAAFQLTFLGAPMVYYGDEAGMWGGRDPDDRKPMVWTDLSFSPEAADPLGRPRVPDPVGFDTDLWACYRALMRARHESPALMRGDLRFLDAAVSRDLVGFARREGDQEALALFNRSDRSRTVGLPAKALTHSRYRDALGSKTFAAAKGRLSVELAPRGYVVLVSEPGS